jgi:hypothetical protein
MLFFDRYLNNSFQVTLGSEGHRVAALAHLLEDTKSDSEEQLKCKHDTSPTQTRAKMKED